MPKLETYRGRPLCLVIVRDRRLPWTLQGELAQVAFGVRKLGLRRRATLAEADQVGELWIVAPASRAAPSRLAM